MATASHRFVLIYSTLGGCYVGIVQHLRKIGFNEAVGYFAEKCDKSAAKMSAIFKALGDAVVEVAAKAQEANAGDFGKSSVVVKGSFASLRGPWVVGKNLLQIIFKVGEAIKTGLKAIIPSVISDDVQPTITSVLDVQEDTFNYIKRGDTIQIAGDDLAPDTDAEDERVYFRNRLVQTETIYPATIVSSDLQIVKITCPASSTMPIGDYDLVIQTRCGFGESVSLKTVTRKVMVLK